MSEHYQVKQVILMRTDLRNTQGHKVRSGKLMSQTAHAAMMWLSRRVQAIWEREEVNVLGEDMGPISGRFSEAEKAWLKGSFAKIVVAVDSEAELRRLVALAWSRNLQAEICTDNGSTEFGGVPTVTCAAIGPDFAEKIDEVTGSLKPL